MNETKGAGFSNSLKSHEVLYHNGQDTFDSMSKAKDYRREHYKWDKIRSIFQSNKNGVLESFGAIKQNNPSTIIHKQNEKLVHLHQPTMVLPGGKGTDKTVDEFLNEFESKSSVSFGEEDKKRISRKIKNELYCKR